MNKPTNNSNSFLKDEGNSEHNNNNIDDDKRYSSGQTKHNSLEQDCHHNTNTSNDFNNGKL